MFTRLRRWVSSVDNTGLLIAVVGLVITVAVGMIEFINYRDSRRSDPDEEVAAFIAGLYGADMSPSTLLKEVKDRLSKEGRKPHLVEMEGLAELELGLLHDAETSFREAAEDRPDAACYLGITLLNLNGVDDEVWGLAEDAHAGRETSCVSLRYQVLSLEGGAPPDLRRMVLGALEGDESNVQLLQLASQAHLTDGKPAEAVSAARAAFEYQPKSAAARLSLLQILLFAIEKIEDDDSQWSEIHQHLDDLSAVIKEGDPRYRELQILQAIASARDPDGADLQLSRDLLLDVAAKSTIPQERKAALGALAQLLQTGAENGTLLPTTEADLRSAGEQLTAEPFAFAYTVSGVTALAAAEALAGNQSDAAQLSQVASLLSTQALNHPASPEKNMGDTVQQPGSMAELTGQWLSPWGEFALIEGNDGTLEGAYTANGVVVVDSLDRNLLTGRWCEADVVSPVLSKGEIRLEMIRTPDGWRAHGSWRYEADARTASWRESWDLTPASADTPISPELLARAATASSTCPA